MRCEAYLKLPLASVTRIEYGISVSVLGLIENMRGVNLHKAGMEGLDAETIDRIIEENSRGQYFCVESRYFSKNSWMMLIFLLKSETHDCAQISGGIISFFVLLKY